MQSKKGFTLIEVMLTIVILVILFAGASVFTNTSMISANFNTSMLEIKRMALTAQNRALEGYNNVNSGLKFAEDSVILFSGDVYDEEDEYNQVLEFTPTIFIETIDFDVNDILMFEKYTGVPLQAGSIDVDSTPGDEASIAVNSSGVISIEYE
jgi:prepilin-type N-terminal cleavage/methylation domain-containing protein